MVSSDYMLKKPSRPSAPRLLLDQRVLPALIDLAGGVEARLERIAARTRLLPLTGLSAGLGIGLLAGLLAVPPRRQRTGARSWAAR